MKISHPLFLVICCLFTKDVYAQTKKDSLKNIFQNERELDINRYKAIDAYYDLYTYSQPDSTLLVADYHFKIAQQKKATEQMVWALNTKGHIQIYKGEIQKGKDYYTQALTAAKSLNNPVISATLQGNIGNTYGRQNKYQEAAKYFSAALKVFQEQKNEAGEARMFNNLGGIYQVIGNYELALEYYEKSLEIFIRKDLKKRKMGLLYLNIGSIQLLQEKNKEAITSFKKSLEIFKAENETVFEAICYNNIADGFLQNGDLDNAYLYAQKVLDLSHKINNDWEIIEARLTIAKVTFENDVNEATSQAEKILASLPKQTSKKIKKEVYQLLYRCYKSQKKMDASLAMYEITTQYADSIQTEQNNFAVIREVVKNDFEVQLYENKLENERAQSALKLKQLKANVAIIAFSTLLIAGVIVYFKSKSRKNKKKRDSLLAELELLKNDEKSKLLLSSNKFELDRKKIEDSINRKLNETDWTVLNIILEDPVIPNKKIAEKAHMSVDGIGSSLRRMYDYYEIKETKYKKISLLTESIKRSNSA